MHSFDLRVRVGLLWAMYFLCSSSFIKLVGPLGHLGWVAQ